MKKLVPNIYVSIVVIYYHNIVHAKILILSLQEEVTASIYNK